MSEAEQPKTNVVFLFGAGASVDAGIPDTYTFVEAFEEHIKQHHPDFDELVLNILKVRERFNERIHGEQLKKVDIEQLLDTLRRLIERENDPLLDFYDEKRFSLDVEQNSFTELKELLENFIRDRVIIEDESKLEYLKELLKFDKPIEVYSTNYDTCIEQLSHIHHMRYTDGFAIYWDKESFSKNFDIKHYKMHGSVIWYENEKTKECVKIPVHAFLENKPIALKMIYGENVKPLLIYPAQKAEYVEPLTDLQLMFKERLFNEKTKFVVVVGYSFRDDYIVHMLWDAARVNEDLHVILVAPNAQQIFENKLKYINKEKNDQSRIYDRVICLPYPFSTVIYNLKNHYLNKLTQITNAFTSSLETERAGGDPNWDYSVRLCIDAEFLTKAEYVVKKANKDWQDLSIGPNQELLLYGFKALLHSVICGDGYEERWLDRVNKTLKIFRVENLYIADQKSGIAFLGFNQNGNFIRMDEFLKKWLSPLISEKKKKTELLTPKFKNSLERINPSLEKLEKFHEYLTKLSKGVDFYAYKESENDSAEIKSFIRRLENAKQRRQFISPEPDNIILGVETGRLKNFLGADSFEFKLQSQ